MRRQFIALLMMAIILWASFGASAIVETVDDLFVVEYEPSSFELKPDETGTLVFDVENIGNETWMVALSFNRILSGFTQADIQPSLFELDRNTSQRVTISIQTRAKYRQNPGTSDFMITMYWGKEIIYYDHGPVDEDSTDGHRFFEFQVEDDLSDVKNPFLNILYIIIIIVVIIGVGLMIWKRRKDTPS